MRKNFDVPAIRERLAGKTGKKYWRSLDEIAETEEFQDLLKHEFPACLSFSPDQPILISCFPCRFKFRQ